MTNYVTSKEIKEIAECGINKARQILKEVNNIVENQGYTVINKNKAPRIEVLKYLGLEDK